MSSRAPAARAGGSPAGDAQPRFARPFRGAAAAASLGMDAGCQTEPLPQLEPLRRLRDARGASPERRESGGEKPKLSATETRRDAPDDVSAENLGEVFVRRRRRSSSVERENAALEIERVSVADFERRVAARREALVETGVLEGATRTLEERGGDDARRREKAEELGLSARLTHEQKTYPPNRGSEPGAVLTPEPPSSGFPPLAGGANAFSPLVVRRRPRALETRANENEKKTATAHGRQNSLSGDGDFIAFDTTLPVPPASPSERDGRVRGPTPAGRGGMRGMHAGESGADSAMSAPASPDSPDSDDKTFSVVSSRGASPSSPSRRRGIAIAGGARGRGLSPGRRVVSPGANGTLHFGSAAPRVASRKTSAPESKEPAFLERGGGGGGRDASPSSPSSRAGRASPSSPSRAARRSRATSTSDRRSRNRARAWLAAGSPSRRSWRGGPRLLRAKKKTPASLIRASAEVFWVRGRRPRRRWRWTARTSASRIGVTRGLSRASRVCRAASGAWAAWPAQKKKSWRERTRARLRWSKKKPSRRFLRVWRGSNPRAREETELLIRRRRTAEAGVARRRACSR